MQSFHFCAANSFEFVFPGHNVREAGSNVEKDPTHNSRGGIEWSSLFIALCVWNDI